MDKKEERYNEYIELFSGLSEERLRFLSTLIKKAVNLEDYMDKVEERIEQVGFVEEYKNGENQYGTKESTESKVYNTLLKNYTTVIRTLRDFIPEDVKKDAGDELDAFIQRRKR